MRFNLSTMSDITPDPTGCSSVIRYDTPVAAPAAKKYGLGLELAEFCVSDNLDTYLDITDKAVREKLTGFSGTIFHAPYNECYPTAIDPKAVELAEYRYAQGWELACRYGCEKTVIHSGFVPQIYYPEYFEYRSILFWRDFLEKHPENMTICLENVMETVPDNLLNIVREVNSPRMRLTFDVGHAFVTTFGRGDVFAWLERCAPYISHFHIHNNTGERDTHNSLWDGGIPMERFLHRAVELCPDATFTVECMDSENCARWLSEKGFLEG